MILLHTIHGIGTTMVETPKKETEKHQLIFISKVSQFIFHFLRKKKSLKNVCTTYRHCIPDANY